MNHSRSLVAALVLAATSGLVACGGGAEDFSTGQGPSETLLHRSGEAGKSGNAGGSGQAGGANGGLGSAAASASAFISYLRSLIDQDEDRSKPVKLNGFEPPVSETADPVPLS